MVANTTGSYNVAVGRQALDANSTSDGNTAIGYASLTSCTTSNCTGLGFGSLQNVTTGSENVGVGKDAIKSVTTGSSNIGLGFETGKGIRGATLTTGSSNILIGRQTDTNGASDSYSIVMGVHAVGKGSSTGFISPNDGSVYQGNNSSSWATTSDRRIKKNITDSTVGLAEINQIQVRKL